jgi:hypothetical protein
MASATRTSNSTRAPLPPADNDFPSLSTKPVKASSWVTNKAGPCFSELARSWGIQQKEEDERKKQYTKEKMTEERLKKEQEDKEHAFYRVGLVNTSHLFYSTRKEEQAYAVERYIDDDEEEVNEVYEEEEEEQDMSESDVGWNQRRSKNDLY